MTFSYNYSGDYRNHRALIGREWRHSALITSGEVIIAGAQILKMAVSHFVDVSEEEMVSQQILTTVMTRIVVDKSTHHAQKTTFDLFFYHNIKDNKRNLCQH